jgi:hypothetical protein
MGRAAEEADSPKIIAIPMKSPSARLPALFQSRFVFFHPQLKFQIPINQNH